MPQTVAYKEPPKLKTASKLPEPVGFYMLIGLSEVQEKTEGGIHLTDERIRKEQVATMVGLVMKQGSACYENKVTTPGDPWCKEGDFVIFAAYSGVRVMVHGVEMRMIMDDTVIATVENPYGVGRPE